MSFKHNVGLEIETPFSFYYPDLWDTYFLAGKKKYIELDGKEKQELNVILKEREPHVFEKLEEISKTLLLTRGRDKYWEFVFPAIKDKEELKEKIQTLIIKGCLPANAPLSVQVTIGGVDFLQAHAILFFLEKDFLTQKRIEEAFRESDFMASWGRKGQAGVAVKHKAQLLYGDKVACELRTLRINMNDTVHMLDTLELLMEKEPQDLIDEAKKDLERMGLPWKRWGEKEFKSFGEKLGR